jgi:hypothetical protein
MNLPQAKIHLEKIISLYKSLSADEKNISAIERDLMLNYIRQLYETFLEIPANATASTPPKTVAPPPPPPKPEPPKPVYEAPKAPPPPVYEQPKPVVEAPKPAPPPVVEQPKPVYEQPKPVYQQPVAPPPPAPKPEAPKPINYGNVSSEVEALFEEIAGKELSDRLSNAPIADLTKAFGLNDRLLTQNELFGGNKSAFDETVKDLNNTGSFDTAKSYLIDLATRYNWAANEDRKKQAKSFIKLVRRRFRS